MRVVVTHQPVAVTRPQDEINLLHGGDRAVRIPFILPLHERFADLPRKVWAVQAGTAVSRRIRHEAGNSINLIRYDGPRSNRRDAVVERWDYLDSQQCFRPVDIKELHCEASGDVV